MRRSICFCEPNYALAGNEGNWKFVFTTASLLSKGAHLRFDFGSTGRPVDWQIPSTNLKNKGNIIWAELPNEKTITPTVVQSPEANSTSFEFTLPIELKSGDTIAFHLQDSAAQKMVQRRRPFHLHIDPKGKGEYKESETFFLDVRGNTLHNLRIIAPSLVSRNKRFDVIVRFEDVYGNLTSNAPEGTLIDLSYQHLRENLSWKLFIPETGFIALPNLYFNEPGIYRIQLKNLTNHEQFYSPPIKCLPEGAVSLYWGALHGESERLDSQENVESFLRHMRDDKALQFFATSSFDSEEETSNDIWKGIVQQVAEFNEDDRFVALLGFQWEGEPKEEGMRQFVFLKDGKPIMRRKDTKTNSLKKIYKTNNPKEMIAIPTFTMGKSTCYDFQDFNNEFEKVVEIYNAWGSSECSAKEGNLRPIQGGKQAIGEAVEGSIQQALNRGCRFGFVAGGYDDRGPYSQLFDTDQSQYTPGLTAILAKEHSRASLFEALQNRSCYATTGERIILGVHIAGFGMGSELDTKARPGLELNRHITGYCIGTRPIHEAMLIRNGKIYRSLDAKGDTVEFEIDDSDLLPDIALEGKEGQNPFIYYYLRVIQEDGHTAWSSPIWVEISSRSIPTAGPKKIKKVSIK
ncbi:MAG: DUF3604 domain-containing protein [Chlamydiae bacterium RIFCSPHIGHO2_12_FULL_44_59]|nr:MAG: DUF3604 domain-containing protein [Chlamydiae bacterium RIFCSPHIGHO2_01_FULL_44_39]OGN57117.1 MAG: DUF3604 domain-containing protein [Chlamydiae bacterium RIFCSPHIGHO2_02_FULL_45_9]OGN59865.1 MAG: DUF3604 domain-containing protein [Chlamydiae bacterium RIFCSPHIGHO2_12_FULL_44_59]OGN66072.1 MAG: DUF3604 domain-containing protein [Chlamydiae bacterium RIFCSPLOWO2_01_FULL_44_52]OGN68608.1 MAG: DUF3604 domain-containing protein [Chlamydiae bacterium RIFCSPLOWO2_02_FULL_45_22]OGN69720.1 MAG